MRKALINSALLLLTIIGFPLSALAACVVAKTSDGTYTHICDDYKVDSYKVPSDVGDALMGPKGIVSRPDDAADNAYMRDFSTDTVGADMDFGAMDDPGIGAAVGSDSADDF